MNASVESKIIHDSSFLQNLPSLPTFRQEYSSELRTPMSSRHGRIYKLPEQIVVCQNTSLSDYGPTAWSDRIRPITPFPRRLGSEISTQVSRTLFHNWFPLRLQLQVTDLYWVSTRTHSKKCQRRQLTNINPRQVAMNVDPQLCTIDLDLWHLSHPDIFLTPSQMQHLDMRK